MKKIVLATCVVIMLSILIWNCEEKMDGVEKFGRNKINEKEKIIVNVGNHRKELKFSFEKINAPKEERIWKEFEMVSKFKIGGIEDETLLCPSRVKIDNNENIYVLDWADCSVKLFDKMGNFIKKYGKKGKGPGEITNAFNFDVINNGKIAILGLNDNKFVIFDDNEIDEFKCTLMPTTLSFVSPNEVVTFQIMDPITHSPFQKVNYKNDVITDYQNILDKESFSGKDFGMLPFLIGDIHRYKSNNLVFISSVMGYVVSFTEDGLINKVFKLIDDGYETGITKREGIIGGKYKDIVSFPRRDEYLFESSNIFGNDLFVFCNPVRLKPGGFVVDIYSLAESEYKFSLLLKGMENIFSVFLTHNKMYIVKKNSEVEVFDYKIK